MFEGKAIFQPDPNVVKVGEAGRVDRSEDKRGGGALLVDRALVIDFWGGSVRKECEGEGRRE